MASFSNTIKTTIYVGTSGATGNLKSFRQSIQDADGASAKMKAGFSSMGDSLKANAASIAAGAGTALIGFAVKSVAAFQELALETGKMSDTLGIAAEDASRWIEVAGDIGASGEDVTKAMARMEREVAKAPAQFERLGVSIAYTKNGAVDANETFIRTVEALKKIKDPTARQEAANDLLGKSWGNIAEIVNGDVRAALDSVSDAKVIDDAEVAKAREFRDALDELMGKVEDFSQSLGSELVPKLTETINAFEKASDFAGKFSGPLDDLGVSFTDIIPGVGSLNKAIEFLGKDTEDTTKPVDGLAQSATQLASYMQFLEGRAAEAAGGIEEIGDEAVDTSVKIDQFAAGWDRLMGKFSAEGTFNSMVDSFDDIETAAMEAFEAAKEGPEEAEAANKRLRDAVLSNKEAVASYLQEVLKLPASQATEIIAMLEAGQYDEVMRLIGELTMDRDMWVTPKLTKDNLIVGIDVAGAKVNTGKSSQPLPPGFSLPAGFNPQPMMSGVTIDAGEGLAGGTNRLIKGRSSGMSLDAAVPAAQAVIAEAIKKAPLAKDLLAQVEALYSSKDALDSSNDSWTEQLKKYKEAETASLQGLLTTEEWDDAQKDATKSMIGAARAATDYAVKQAALEGKTLSANRQAELQQENLRSFQNLVAPGSALSNNLQAYVELLDKVRAGTEDTTEADKGAEQAAKDAERAAADRTAAALKQADADLAAGRATQAVADATNDYVSALFRSTETAEEAAQRNDDITRSERSLVDSIIREADALTEQVRIRAAAGGTTLSGSDLAAIKASAISAESSKLSGGAVKSTLDQYVSTINLNIAAPPGADAAIFGRQVYDALDREMKRRGLGGLQ